VRPGPAAVLALVVAALSAPPASAHLLVDPPFLTAGATETLVVTVHNDRSETMTGFELTVPAGARIASISTTAGWSGEVNGRVARWTGGELEGGTPVDFEVALGAPAAEGPVELLGDQLYPGGDTVAWPFTLTVVPASDGNGGFGTTSLVGLTVVGLLALGTVAFVLVRRRGSLQEK
jgi:hypothetical protein